MLNETQLNTLKNQLFDELEKVSHDNDKIRYTKGNYVIHKEHFEITNSKLGWYIDWGGDINNVKKENYVIRHIKEIVKDSSSVHDNMLKVIMDSEKSIKELSAPVVAVITDIANNVISSGRNIKSENKSSPQKHSEQLALEGIKNIALPVKKLKIYITLIPCIHCFKKIYKNKNIEEIIYLKDYRSSLVYAQHREWLKTVNNKRDYFIRTEFLKTESSRIVSYYHDAYIIAQRGKDIIESEWFLNIKNKNKTKFHSSELTYIQFEKLSIIMRYTNDKILKFKDNEKNTEIIIDTKKFEVFIKNVRKQFNKGIKGNKDLLKYLEDNDNSRKV